MSVKFNLNKNQKATFALLRTNPKLTANVKLVADSSGDIFLSAFAANKTLSGANFQKFALSNAGSYATDLAKFFRKVPSVEAYQVYRKFSDFTPYNQYRYQYENQYNYGATFNTVKVYDEQYKILAPIWLDRQVPGKFVIYRVQDTDYELNYSEDVEGQNSRILDLLQNATIVKTFDLSKKTKLGAYLHKHVFDSNLPNSAIDMNFSIDGPTQFKGIDIKTGGFATKQEYLIKDLVQRDFPEIFFNEIITQGFERNNLVSANLINLEFMFDDSDATDYEIYRYFGVYVDDVPESKLDIVSINKEDMALINADTIESLYELDNGITALDMLPTQADLQLPTLNYLKAGNGQYYHIKNNVDFDTLELPLSIDPSDNPLEGFKKDDTIKIIKKPIDNKGFIRLKIVDNPNHNDRFFLGNANEIKAANYDLADFTFIADNTLPAGKFIDNRFSANGNLTEVTAAINGVITFYQTEFNSNTLLITDYTAGANRKSVMLGVYSQNLIQFMDFEYATNEVYLDNSVVPVGVNTDFTEWSQFSTRGGSSDGSVYLVDKSEIGKLAIGDYVKSKDKDQYIQITDITPDGLDDTKFRFILKKPAKITNDAVVQTWIKSKPEVGKFAAYDFKDFDFDFHSTEMSNIGELSLTENGSEYFVNLTPVLQAETIETDVDLDFISSEYDRLKENELIETATKSRMVPHINKFALKDGFNARNLPYMLTLSEAFGPDNISPNITNENGRNVDLLNMDHFHFNQIPNQYYLDGVLDQLQSYTDFNATNGITIDQLKSIDVDYFSMYFDYVGAMNPVNLNTWQNSKQRVLYSKFSNGSNELEPSTVFRGLRYLYKERKERLQGAPVEFINSSKVNDYKFAVILNYIESDRNLTEYSVIKNDKFKHITVVIDLNVQNFNATIDRKNAYELLDILDSNNNIINTDIPFKINLADPRSNWNLEQTSVYSQGVGAFNDYITTDREGRYSWIIFEEGGITFGMRVLSIISDSEIIVEGLVEVNINGTEISKGGATLDPSLQLPRNDFQYFRGGEEGFTKVLEDIVAYNFANRFNQFDLIDYLTIDVNGNEIVNEFVLAVEDGQDFIKPSLITTKPDNNRPKSYQISNVDIGKKLAVRDDGGYYTILNRMNGSYNPLFKDIILFTDIYTKNKVNIPAVGETTINITNREDLIYNKVNNLGVAFESYKLLDDSYGFIGNYYFHKVNDKNSKNLLKLSETTDKLPLYPKIGEIAIDKRDLNMFKSKYDETYFTRSLPGTSFEYAEGTLSPIEIKSFMASTVMKVKDNYDITAFSSTKEDDLNELDYLRVNQLNKTAIHFIETDTQIVADFYLPSSIKDELIEDRILDKFRKYVSASTSFGDKDSIEDDLQIYIYNNIVNRFIIDNIVIYGISGKDVITEFESVKSASLVNEIGYNLETNYEIQSYQNDGLSFRLIYNKKLGFGHKLRVLVQIQA